jgi:hypothetical protein
MSRRTWLIATLLLPTLHFLWCLALQTAIVAPSEGSWTWFPVFIVDFPFSILVLWAEGVLHESAGVDLPPLVTFGIAGTIWWYFLSAIVVSVVARLKARGAATR